MLELSTIPESAVSKFSANELMSPIATRKFNEHKAGIAAQLQLIKTLFANGAVAPIGIDVTHEPTIRHLREFMKWCGSLSKDQLQNGVQLNQTELQKLCGRNLNAEECARRACLIGTGGNRKLGIPNTYKISRPHVLSLNVCIAQYEIFRSHCSMNSIIDEDAALKSTARHAETARIFSEFQFSGVQNELLAA